MVRARKCIAENLNLFWHARHNVIKKPPFSRAPSELGGGAWGVLLHSVGASGCCVCRWLGSRALRAPALEAEADEAAVITAGQMGPALRLAADRLVARLQQCPALFETLSLSPALAALAKAPPRRPSYAPPPALSIFSLSLSFSCHRPVTVPGPRTPPTTPSTAALVPGRAFYL